ncbi:HNH endonuclease [Gordonia phage Agueybana]|uniref:HNH endonuclease n=1 Tax=Gordonia phage Agueybana TaxID=2859634 RepID=A0AC61NKG4_9CAUD|nr:HNH endonuclease [Gordonia phage Agueybana]QYC54643.1 HNH endonuclease [Gordonia phage Agueybana]
MPTAPGRVCNRCRKIIPAGQKRCACRPAWEGSSYGNSGTDRRQRAIRDHQLRDHPICQTPGCTRLAATADHIHNIADGGSKYDPTNYQSLCGPHHDQKTQAEAQRGRHRPR